MGQTASTFLLGLMLAGTVAFAAEPTGPRTLENLLAATDAEPQAAVVADEAPDEAEEPPAARKEDPLQQRLDAALAEYNPAIETAINELAKEIEEEFNKATKKGDIELARKCKKAEESLNERGIPPEGDFLKHAREETTRTVTRAGAKLAAEFEAVAKECLRVGDLDRAESVLSEKADLLAEMKEWRAKRLPTRVKADPRPNTSEATGPRTMMMTDAELTHALKGTRWRFQADKMITLRADGKVDKSWGVLHPDWQVQNGKLYYEGKEFKFSPDYRSMTVTTETVETDVKGVGQRATP
jgi:hypothetical protein